MTQPHPTVLIVEDDAAMRASLADLFEREGYAVKLAGNGAEAITLLEEGLVPCVVLVDLIMPGLVGQELIEYLRSAGRLARVPVAIVSGVPELAPVGYRVFKKPVALGALLEFVRGSCCELAGPPGVAGQNAG